MDNYLLAIDVAQRIPNFLVTVSAYTKSEPVIADTMADIVPEIRNANLVNGILISIYQPLTEDFLSQFPNLQFIAVLGTSPGQIPVYYCKDRNINVSVVSEYCDIDTAEWVMFKILEFFRTKRSPAESSHLKSLGIIGMGGIGKALLPLARAFNMSVYYNSKSLHPDLLIHGTKSIDKETMFSICDVISFHTPAYLPWLSHDILRHAKTNLCLINTCMGRLSLGSDLENFLNARPDLTLIMDKIAAESYKTLTRRAQIADEPAFLTLNSQKRLVDKFFQNIASLF